MRRVALALLILMAQANYSVLTVASGKITGTLSGYVALVKITDARFKSQANGGGVYRSDGRDLVPYSATDLSTKLDFERPLYDPTTGTIIDFVYLTSAAVGSVIVYGYGDTSITTDQSNASGVWSAASVSGVWHLGDGSSLSLADSSGNGNTLTNHNTATATAAGIYGAVSLNGSNQYLSAAANASLRPGSAFTFSCWSNLNSSATSGRVMMATENAFATNKGFDLFSNHAFGVFFEAGNGTTCGRCADGPAVNDSTTYKWMATWDGTTMNLYKNGSLFKTASFSGPPGYNTSNGLNIGAFSGSDGFWGGWIAEPRLASVARSSAWAAAEYQNENSPSTFFTLGTEQTVSGGVTGTLSVTLEAATLAATGVSVVKGQLAVTLADATLSATGVSVVTGQLTETLDDATLSATGGSVVKGSLALTLDDATLVATGGNGAIAGTLSVTLDDATLVATGVSVVDGVLSATLSDATLVATGSAPVRGTLAITLDDAAAVATGIGPIQGLLNGQLEDATLVATGVAPVHGTLSVTLDDAMLFATSSQSVSGSLSATLADATLSAQGVAPVQGALAVTLENATLAATGATVANGTLTVTLADATLSATGQARVAATVDATLEAATLVAIGQSKVRGSLSVTLDDATLVAVQTAPWLYGEALHLEEIEALSPMLASLTARAAQLDNVRYL